VDTVASDKVEYNINTVQERRIFGLEYGSLARTRLFKVNFSIITVGRVPRQSGALPHKKGYFVKYRCLKKDVTFRQYNRTVGGAYDESTKQARIARSSTGNVPKSQ